MSRARSPYMEWAKHRPRPAIDLAGSNLLPCTLDDLPGARDAVDLAGESPNGYLPLVEAIAARYSFEPENVATAVGCSGANFLALAALVGTGDDVLFEQPGYDPLAAAAEMLGARVVRFERRFEDGWRLDPERIASALTPRARVLVISSPHNPSGVLASKDDLSAIGRLARPPRAPRPRGRGVPGPLPRRPPPGRHPLPRFRLDQQPDQGLRPRLPALRVVAGVSGGDRKDPAGARRGGRVERHARRPAVGRGLPEPRPAGRTGAAALRRERARRARFPGDGGPSSSASRRTPPSPSPGSRTGATPRPSPTNCCATGAWPSSRAPFSTRPPTSGSRSAERPTRSVRACARSRSAWPPRPSARPRSTSSGSSSRLRRRAAPRSSSGRWTSAACSGRRATCGSGRAARDVHALPGDCWFSASPPRCRKQTRFSGRGRGQLEAAGLPRPSDRTPAPARRARGRRTASPSTP